MRQCPVAFTEWAPNCCPLPLRRRARRPHLERDPLGGQTLPGCRSPQMDWLLVALLLATPAPDSRAGHSAMATPGAEPTAVDAQTPSVQDTEAQVLLRLEDDWALGLTRRAATLFRRLLADGFGYTQDERTVGRDDVLRDILSGPGTVETAPNERI